MTIVVAVSLAVTTMAACQPTSSLSSPPPPNPGAKPGWAPSTAIIGTPGGMWISKAELMKLPTKGPAWERLVERANGDWGRPSFSNLNANHDTKTLAGALVAVRTGNKALVNKTRAAIMEAARVKKFNRVLELARNLTSYVVAADLVGLPYAQDVEFRQFLRRMRSLRLQGHAGGVNLVTTALQSPGNWGTMARAAEIAIDLYLQNGRTLQKLANTHRAWLGEPVRSGLRYTETSWHPADAQPSGIVRKETVLYGQPVDGVLPEEQRRTGEPSAKDPAKGSYPWEAMQGAVVSGVLLHRAGLVDFNAGDHALVRAANWLTHDNQNPALGDDRWQPWLLNKYGNAGLPTQEARSPGKNMAWSDWTAQN